jgi:hypothetical protein
MIKSLVENKIINEDDVFIAKLNGLPELAGWKLLIKVSPTDQTLTSEDDPDQSDSKGLLQRKMNVVSQSIAIERASIRKEKGVCMSLNLRQSLHQLDL